MKKGYWKWLILGLAKFFFAFVGNVPYVIFEVIPEIFTSCLKSLYNELNKEEPWEHVFVISVGLLLFESFLWLLLFPVIIDQSWAWPYWNGGWWALLFIMTFAFYQMGQIE